MANKKKSFVVTLIMVMCGFFGNAQKYEAQVLVLNLAKYESMRETVKEVKDTYDILNKWYGRIEDVANGDLEIHSVFLDELKTVSPTVSRYYKIAEIIKKQRIMIDHYGDFFRFVRNSENFSEKEIKNLERTFDNLLDESGNYLEELFMVVTASELNMSDNERIKIIDRLADNIDGQINFISDMNNTIYRISTYKDREKKDIREYEMYNGINMD